MLDHFKDKWSQDERQNLNLYYSNAEKNEVYIEEIYFVKIWILPSQLAMQTTLKDATTPGIKR